MTYSLNFHQHRSPHRTFASSTFSSAADATARLSGLHLAQLSPQVEHHHLYLYPHLHPLHYFYVHVHVFIYVYVIHRHHLYLWCSHGLGQKTVRDRHPWNRHEPCGMHCWQMCNVSHQHCHSEMAKLWMSSRSYWLVHLTHRPHYFYL